MSTIAYKCPCCSAPLTFSGASGRLECASCGNCYEMDALDAMYTAQSSGGVQFDLPTETFGADDARAMQAYICKSCGAELMTEGNAGLHLQKLRRGADDRGHHYRHRMSLLRQSHHLAR